MANEHIICPACGMEVPEGRFCKFCGKPLHPKDYPELEPIEDSMSIELDAQSEESSQPKTTPKFEFSVEAMSSRDLSLLLSKVELAVIVRELDVLIEQIRATRHALNLEHADKSIIVTRAETLRNVLEKTKTRRKELLEVKGRLEIEDSLLVLEEKQSKLAMLEDIASSIEREVYNEKHDELLESIKTLKSQLKKQTKIAKDWIKVMEKKIKELHKDMSRLTAQHKIGDITTSRYDKMKASVERSIAILEGGCNILQQLIERAETLQAK